MKWLKHVQVFIIWRDSFRRHYLCTVHEIKPRKYELIQEYQNIRRFSAKSI